MTATVYLRNLEFYYELNNTNPKGLLKVAKTKLSGIILLILYEDRGGG
ncbi:MAG: hypothetical protein QXP55_04145 [Nitrososphaerales archaeon]